MESLKIPIGIEKIQKYDIIGSNKRGMAGAMKQINRFPEETQSERLANREIHWKA